MGFLDWFNNNISKPVLDAGKWIGQKIVTPALGWIKNNVPVVGDIVRAAEPAINLAGRVWNTASTAADENKAISEGRQIKRAKLDLPSGQEVIGAIGSVANAASQVKGLGGPGALMNAGKAQLRQRVLGM